MGGGNGTDGGNGAVNGGMVLFVSTGSLPGGTGGAGNGVPLIPVLSPTLGDALCAQAEPAPNKRTSATALRAAILSRPGPRLPRYAIAHK